MPQRLQLRQHAGAVGGVGHAELHRAPLRADAAGEPRVLLAQRAPRVVAKIGDLRLDDVGPVDLEHDMRAALQIEAEHDLLGGDPARQRSA